VLRDFAEREAEMKLYDEEPSPQVWDDDPGAPVTPPRPPYTMPDLEDWEKDLFTDFGRVA
jgi:hypothetical protein